MKKQRKHEKQLKTKREKESRVGTWVINNGILI
jgi:hypothetical protein